MPIKLNSRLKLQKTKPVLSFFLVLTTFLVVIVTLMSCAPDKNRRDRLNHVRAGSGSARKLDKTTMNNPDKNSPADQSESDNTTDAVPTTDAMPTTDEICKVTQSFDGITDAQKALPLCGSIDVQTNADGSFKIKNFIGGIENRSAYFFKPHEIAIDKNDEKLMHLSYLSVASSAELSRDTFYIAYLLQTPLSKIDKDSIVVRIQAGSEVTTPIETVPIEVGDTLQIRFTNPEAITNINFKIEIDYKLK